MYKVRERIDKENLKAVVKKIFFYNDSFSIIVLKNKRND